jgi:5-methylcytosine-specific restriction endonuclease McrA
MTCQIKAQAKKEGKVRYFTGKPCANGHIVERNTHTGRCVECNRLRMRRYWDENPDAVQKRNEMLQGYKFRNPENYGKYQEAKKQRWQTDIEYRTNTNEKTKEINRIRYQDPEYKAKKNQQGKEWFKNNAGIAKAKRARRRASMSNSTPNWLTDIQKAQISEFYEIATALETQTGIKHHVDHIVPLKANGISGLHVPWNLQILTANENLSKGNRYEI